MPPAPRAALPHPTPQKHQKHRGTSKPANPGCSPRPRPLEQLWSSGSGEKLNSKRENPPCPCHLPPQGPLTPLPSQFPALGLCLGSLWPPRRWNCTENTPGCFYLQEGLGHGDLGDGVGSPGVHPPTPARSCPGGSRPTSPTPRGGKGGKTPQKRLRPAEGTSEAPCAAPSQCRRRS